MKRNSSFASSWNWKATLHHLMFVGFPLALFWRPLFARKAFFWGTPLLQFVPWQRLAARMWRSGHLPLWNHLVGCGAPLAANYQTAAFYPLNALYLLLPAEVALTWTVAIHLALAGWGFYRWARAAGLDPFPALVGALALEGSGFLVGKAALFPSIAITYPWIPIWLWRVEVMVQREKHPYSDGVDLANTVWLGLALGLGLLAGHAQTAFYGGLLVGAYAIYRTLWGLAGNGRRSGSRPIGATGDDQAGNRASSAGPTLRISLLLALAAIIGLGMAAVQLLATGELLLHSQRSTGVSDDIALTYSFWPWRLITTVAPDFFGNPGRGNYWGYGTYWEDLLYIGVLPLLLSVWAITRAFGPKGRLQGAKRVKGNSNRETRGVDSPVDADNVFHRRWHGSGSHPPSESSDSLIWFWALSIVMSMVLALGKNSAIFTFLFARVPGFDMFKAPTRWLAVTTVGLSALTAIGAQRWPRGHPARRRGALVATIGAAVLVGGLAAPELMTEIPSTFGPATARAGVFILFAGVLSLLRGRIQRSQGQVAAWWQVAVVVFIGFDLLSLGWSLVPSVDRSLYHGRTESAAVLKNDRDHARIYWPSDPTHQDRRYDAQHRVKFDYLRFDDFGPQDTAYWHGMREDQVPNSGMLDGIASANNYDPLLVDEYAALLEAAVEAPRLLPAMGVTHVASDRPWPEATQIHAGHSAAFYRLPSPPGRAWIVPQAQHVASDQTLQMMTSSSFDFRSTVLVHNALEPDRGEPMKSYSSARIALRDGPNRVTIEAGLEAPGYLVLADTWYPGWRAVVDGKPVTLLRANHAFRAVLLNAGQHTIQMTYRPVSVLIGGGISLATAFVLLLALLWSRTARQSLCRH